MSKEAIMKTAAEHSFNLFERALWHEKNNKVSLKEYVDSEQIKLSDSIKDRIKIYLDTKFWIYLRDGMKEKNDKYSILYTILKELVKNGKIVCPLSFSVYSEVSKQSDKETRIMTAKIIDELSLGISVKNVFELYYNDAFSFIVDKSGFFQRKMQKSNFDYTGSVLSGTAVPIPNMPLPNISNNSIQKAWFDFYKTMKLSDIVDKYNEESVNYYKNMNTRLQKYNNEVVKPHYQNEKLQEILQNELRECVESINFIPSLMKEVYEMTGGKVSENEVVDENKIKNFFCNTLINRKDKSKILDSLYMFGVLNTLNVYEQTRPVQDNDDEDFFHAVQALSTCDYFFTEKRLKHLLNVNPFKLSDEFNTIVISDIDEAISFVEKI